jgi:hypothetical protein
VWRARDQRSSEAEKQRVAGRKGAEQRSIGAREEERWSREAGKQKSRRKEGQKNRRAEEQKNRRTAEQKSRDVQR